MDCRPNVVVPVCGMSTRFSGVRPKFLLTHPHGNSMLAESLKGLAFDYNLYIITLREHVNKYGYIGLIDEQFTKKPSWIILDEQTQGQADTIYQGIQKTGLEGQIIVKDCDNFFECNKPQPNSVACYDLRDLELVNARNKSYARVSISGRIVSVIEKQIVGSIFCCGLYSFESSHDFCQEFKNLPPTCFISDIIQRLIDKDKDFWYLSTKNYLDWGTLEDWKRYCSEFKVLFVDCDGVLVENSAGYMNPVWGTTNAIQKNIDRLNKLMDTGKVQLIITTSRKQEYENITRNQLDKAGLRYSQIIFGLQHGQRIVINDYADSNPYPSCLSINLKRNSDELEKLL